MQSVPAAVGAVLVRDLHRHTLHAKLITDERSECFHRSAATIEC